VNPADPIAADPPLGLHPPASTPHVVFDSGGASLPGFLHLPAGPGPHPIVLLLHGFPGNERNFDLAHALRRAGYAALVFHYRGSWGVAGSWSWGNVLEDSARVVARLREPAFVAAHRLDASRLAVVGHSLGGFAALMTAAADPAIGAVVSIAGFDMGAALADPLRRAEYLALFEENLLMLRGTSGEALVSEMESAGPQWSLPGLAGELARRPVLLIGAALDDVTPMATHHLPLVAAYDQRTVLEHHEFSTDHAFSDHRIALARTVIDFLDRQLLPPGP
jgi:uncharacterized protein